VLLERSAEAEAHVMRMAGQPHGEIRLAAFATASATVVADAIAALRARGAPVGVRLVEGNPGDALASLRLRHEVLSIAGYSLSEMHGREVPSYTTLVEVARQVNVDVVRAGETAHAAARRLAAERVASAMRLKMRLPVPA
jgi:hypothetical protein